MTLYIIVFIYMTFLIFVPHIIRSWAFNRHEAITFESSAVSALLSLLLIWQYGLSVWSLVVFAVLIGLFVCNALTQWKYYMKLQKIIQGAFKNRREYFTGHNSHLFAIEALFTMASMAIMPSFSRFIEQSKLFENRGGLIGLIRSVMKHKRFQEKKYAIRESFAENVNLIGPCKPQINSIVNDDDNVIPGAVHANDLALGKSDEIKGLLTFDLLGFGAGIGVFFYLIYRFKVPINTCTNGISHYQSVIAMFISAVAFVVMMHLLRHLGFARYESLGYEFSFTALVISSFRVLDLYMRGEAIRLGHWLICFFFFGVFVILSIINKNLDKSLHKKIYKKYDELIYSIPLETETDFIKRKIIANLKEISRWTIVPFPGSKERSAFLKSLTNSRIFQEFETISLRKLYMPSLTTRFLMVISPEYSKSIMKEEPKSTESKFTKSNKEFLAAAEEFKLPEKQLERAKIVNTLLSILSFILLFVLIGIGII